MRIRKSVVEPLLLSTSRQFPWFLAKTKVLPSTENQNQQQVIVLAFLPVTWPHRTVNVDAGGGVVSPPWSFVTSSVLTLATVVDGAADRRRESFSKLAKAFRHVEGNKLVEKSETVPPRADGCAERPVQEYLRRLAADVSCDRARSLMPVLQSGAKVVDVDVDGQLIRPS